MRLVGVVSPTGDPVNEPFEGRRAVPAGRAQRPVGAGVRNSFAGPHAGDARALRSPRNAGRLEGRFRDPLRGFVVA
jgi:hypothetical protein